MLGDDDGGGAQQAVAELVAHAELLEHVALGHVGGLLMGDGFLPVGVEGFAGGVEFFEAGFEERGFELAVNHAHAGLERVAGAGLRVVRGGHGHVEVVEDGDEFVEEAAVGVADVFLPVAGGALLEVLEVGSLAEEAVPVFVGLGGLGAELVQLGGSWERRGSVGAASVSVVVGSSLMIQFQIRDGRLHNCPSRSNGLGWMVVSLGPRRGESEVCFLLLL